MWNGRGGVYILYSLEVERKSVNDDKDGEFYYICRTKDVTVDVEIIVYERHEKLKYYKV